MRLFKAGLLIIAAVTAGCGGESGIRVNQTFEYYTISGNSELELAEQVNEKGFIWDDGNVYASATAVRLGADLEPRCSTPWRWVVGSVKVTLDIVTILPAWQAGRDSSQELRDRWDSFIERLVYHETGHRDRAVATASELLAAAQALSAASSRAALEKNLEALKRELTAHLATEEFEYDRATMHGYTQGAVFP